jgi:translation initiation factor 1A
MLRLADEARNLKSYGEFPESVKINETVDFVGGDLDDDIEFDDVDSADSGSDDDGVDDIDGI